MKQFDKIRQRIWQWWYTGSPMWALIESYHKKITVLQHRVSQLEQQLDIEPDDEDVDAPAKEIMDIFFGHGEQPMQDEDFCNLYAAEVTQKASVKTKTAIIKLAASHDNILHIKICRTPKEIERIEQEDRFGFLISKSQARAFIAATFQCMKAATEISRVGFDESDLTNGIRIMVPDASDLSPFVRILEDNKEMLAKTIQWESDSK